MWLFSSEEPRKSMCAMLIRPLFVVFMFQVPCDSSRWCGWAVFHYPLSHYWWHHH